MGVSAREQCRFQARVEGVAASIGTHGGAGCRPLLRYSVTEDGRVEISDNRSILFTWEQVEFSDEVVTVRCDQQVKRFTFTPGKKQERYLP